VYLSKISGNTLAKKGVICYYQRIAGGGDMFKLQVFKVAEWVDLGPRIYYLGDCDEEVIIYTYFWLLQDGENNVLVDVGVDYSHGKEILPVMKQSQEERPIARLAQAGVNCDEITHIVLTHLHWDHFSPIIDEFPNAHFYVQKREVDTVLNPPHPWFAQFIYIDHVNKLVGEYKDRTHLIDGDEEILPGLYLFWTGGHTPGHQSVRVDTEFGRVVLAGDVVFTYKNLEEDTPGGFNSCLVECFKAMERIRKEADLVFPGHDPRVLEVIQRLGQSA